MERLEILITFHDKQPADETYLLSVKNYNGEVKFTKFPAFNWNIDPGYFPNGYELGNYLAAALLDYDSRELVENFRRSLENTYEQGTFLLDIKPAELFSLPWEDIFSAPLLSFYENKCMVIRYLPEPATLLTSPFSLPIDVLVASDPGITIQSLVTENALRYFRAHTLMGLTGDYLPVLLAQSKFEIVHVACKAEFKNRSCVLIPGTNGFPVQAEEMFAAVKKSGTRLLILHCIDSSVKTLLYFAHSILKGDGPAILVVKEPVENIPWTFDDFYMSIVHDQFLHFGYNRIPRQMHPALLLASGGAGLLKVSALAAKLTTEYASQFAYSVQLMNELQKKIDKTPKSRGLNEGSIFKDRLYSLNEFLQSTVQDANIVLNYDRESGGMEPLKKIELINTELALRLKEIEVITKRVVNCRFRFEDREIGSNEKLEKGSDYNFELQIGLAKKNSIVQDAVAFPDEELSSFISEEGLELRVELFSNDFIIPESSRTFILPAPPDESDSISFALKTPALDGMARMRVCIYFQQNLVQSLLVRSIIGDFSSTELAGNTAIVDYSLSNSLTNLERLPPRTLNIALNESGNGTHSIYISGQGIKRQLDFGEGIISSAVKQTRDALQYICSEKDREGKLTKYRFDKNNKGNEKDFIADMIDLAQLGYKLYNEVLLNFNDRELEDQFRTALDKQTGSVIQVSSTKSAMYVFPWALIYDKPFFSGDNHKVCPQFLSDIKHADPDTMHSTQVCMQGDCPHKTDNTIVCPSGFWGYRHIIEQPLSVKSDGTGVHEITLEINAKPGSPVMMGVSLDLNDVVKHLDEIKALGKFDVLYLDSIQKIRTELDRQDYQLIYFYCHGGRSGPDTWLGVGKKEKFVPSDLNALKIWWKMEQPFVFINGCHTTDVSPDDFVQFNRAFAYCKASGVMGTEISITESLARYFANGFLKYFLNEEKVGMAVQKQRMVMLKDYNLLGLAYTPYCSADLQIKHQN